MKHGAFNMIPKLNNKVCLETVHIPTIQENYHVEITNEDNVHHLLPFQGQCSILILFTRPKFIIWKHRSGYVRLCVEKGLKIGPMIGLSTMTTLQVTKFSLLRNFRHKNLLLNWNTHPIA
jgi:hypothetical protein